VSAHAVVILMNLLSQLVLLWLMGWSTCNEYWQFRCTADKHSVWIEL